jgi:hypothetical protein
MGLKAWWRRRGMRDPVNGSLLVKVCPQPASSPESAYYSALVLGVVSAPGVTPRAVRFSTTVPARRCPVSKQRIPVIVDRADPSRVSVRWNEVPVRDPLR